MATIYCDPTQFPSSSVHDPDNRDPVKINQHLQFDFFHVIAEPDTSAYSFEVFHKISHQVYHYSKIFIYRLLTVLVGLPLMLFWGLAFGAYTFLMVWVFVPMRQLTRTQIAEMGVYVQAACDAIIGPTHRAMGQMFSNIRVSLSRNTIEAGKQLDV
ncbi:unnamed protein product [Adineta ricciae]|uniref:Caveolin n=1 Tax=Adineta ricciae TaxID=249248 RepID=A0A813VQC9_ADIRI|nr:unnamed protein product [Adineta ricciae]